MTVLPHKTVNKSHDFDLSRLLSLLPNIERRSYWEDLCPGATITPQPFGASPEFSQDTSRHNQQLREDGYFQTDPILSEATCLELRRCVEAVLAAGYPPIFALVYDGFYRALADFDPVLCGVLGHSYRLIPNFWVYHIDTNDEARGFEPHRDAEYPSTLDDSGLPTIVTAWIAVTDATPLNGCMYVLPRGRDPNYPRAVTNLAEPAVVDALENARAIPTRAGSLSCWDQYIVHWGCRSSHWATAPRISYAVYFEREDGPSRDPTAFAPPRTLDLADRLGIISKGLLRYSFAGLRDASELARLVELADAFAAKSA